MGIAQAFGAMTLVDRGHVFVVSRHGHFITSSNLLTQHTILEGSLLANVSSQTGEHFSVILQLLADIHGTLHTPYDCRCVIRNVCSSLHRFG